MILVDTSVWVDHFRANDSRLRRYLEQDEVSTHPFVIGELTCGNIRQREEVLRLLQQLPQANVATHEEVMNLVTRRRLMGRGIGYIDVHLVAAAAITPETRLWTRDRRLAAIASEMNVVAS